MMLTEVEDEAVDEDDAQSAVRKKAQVQLIEDTGECTGYIHTLKGNSRARHQSRLIPKHLYTIGMIWERNVLTVD